MVYYTSTLCDPWTVALQAPPTMGFSRQEYWSGLPFPSPGDLDPGIEPKSPTLQADALTSAPPVKSHCGCWVVGCVFAPEHLDFNFGLYSIPHNKL